MLAELQQDSFAKTVDFQFETHQTLERILRLGRAGNVTALKRFFSDELILRIPKDADFEERLRISWSKITTTGSVNMAAFDDYSSLETILKKDGKEYLIVMKRGPQNWKIVEMPEELLGDFSLPPEEVVELLGRVSSSQNEKVFELYVMPESLALMREEDGSLKKAMEYFSNIERWGLKVYELKPREFAEMRTHKDPNSAVRFYFHDNRWKLELPEGITKSLQSENRAALFIDEVSKEDLSVEELSEPVQDAAQTWTAILAAATNADVKAFQNYLDPKFIALVEKRDGSLKKLMADLARARALGVMLYDPRGKSEKMEIEASGDRL